MLKPSKAGGGRSSGVSRLFPKSGLDAHEPAPDSPHASRFALKIVTIKNTVDLGRRLPNSQLVLYPDAGHGGVFQFYEGFVKRALEFL